MSELLWCGSNYPNWHADDEGRVYRDGTEIKPYPDRQGYLRVWSGGGYRGRPLGVHVLVATAFHGLCPTGMECLHHDDVPNHNRPSNLRWGTKPENVADAVRNGRRPRARTAAEIEARAAELRVQLGLS